MVISLILIALLTLGALPLTYLYSRDARLLWRLSAASIAGSSAFGLIAFVAACFVGLTPAAIVVSLLISMLPLLMLRQTEYRERLVADLTKAKAALDNIDLSKGLEVAFYVGFLIVFAMFFDRAVFELKDGIYTGGSNNYGDLPFHLGAIFSFTEGNNFPPQNPSWAGAKFSYPFMADFLTACFIKLGAEFKGAILAQNVTWAFALLVIIERFTVKLTNNKIAGRIAPALLFFSGGLGFLWFFQDASAATKGIGDFMMHLPKDYTISETFRWGNPMVVLFITQRGILFGIPLTILILQYLWKIFSDGTYIADAPKKAKVKKKKPSQTEEEAKEASEEAPVETAEEPLVAPPAAAPAFSVSDFFKFPLLSSLLIGLLAGTLVLVHLHSLAMLFIVTTFLFALKPAKWPDWIAFGIGTAIIAVPQLAWSISGSATDSSKFFGWHFGWDKRDLDFFWFWFKNTGLVFPMIFAAVYLLWTGKLSTKDSSKAEKGTNVDPKTLVLFYVPFFFLFVITNLMKFAPWEWDNIKILFYWYVGSVPLIAYALAWGWQQRKGLEFIAAALFIVLIFSGALDVWRTASGQVSFNVFPTDAMKVADMVKQKTPKDSLFLNGPIFNTMPILAGRQSLMRYSGHLGSYGIDYGPREADVKEIYLGGANADTLLKKYNIDYVLVSPYEKNDLKANEAYFKKFPIAAESGDFKVYKVKS